MKWRIVTVLRRWLLLAGVVAAVLLADRTTKSLVLQNLTFGDSYAPIPALAPYFQITYVENTGAAFGFLPQAGDFFLILVVVVVIGLLIYYPRIEGRALVTRVALGLVMGGALGNAIDRISYGAVIDFIHYQIPGLFSNVSNLADHAIVFGVLALLIINWRGTKPAPAPVNETEVQSSK